MDWWEGGPYLDSRSDRSHRPPRTALDVSPGLVARLLGPGACAASAHRHPHIVGCCDDRSASIILGFTAIRRGDVATHRAWMTRAYALALGAGTQVFTQGIGNTVYGTSELTTDLSLGAGWAINLAVAEYVIRRRRNPRTSRARAEVGSS